MKLFTTVFSIIVLTMVASTDTLAGAPTCHIPASGPYCKYSGKVKDVYVNTGNLILLYFDTPMDLALPSSVGITGISRSTAAAFLLTDNFEFGKLLYASLLSAQARDTTITVQLRNNYGGYLKIDRIWVH